MVKVVNHFSNPGLTPLQQLLLGQEVNLDILKSLLMAGANPNLGLKKEINGRVSVIFIYLLAGLRCISPYLYVAINNLFCELSWIMTEIL